MSDLRFSGTLKYSFLYAMSVMLFTIGYVALLIKLGGNTIIMQLLGVFAITLGCMYVVVRALQHSHQHYGIASALKLGLIGGVLSTGLLIGVEAVLFKVFGLQMAPEAFLQSGLPYMGLQAMLLFEMLVYSILSSFVVYQYLKKPLEGFRYRNQKEVHA